MVVDKSLQSEAELKRWRYDMGRDMLLVVLQKG